MDHGVSGDESLQIARTYGQPARAATKLIELANERGAPDNVTVAVARVLGDERVTRGHRVTRETTPVRPVHAIRLAAPMVPISVGILALGLTGTAAAAIAWLNAAPG